MTNANTNTKVQNRGRGSSLVSVVGSEQFEPEAIAAMEREYATVRPCGSDSSGSSEDEQDYTRAVQGMSMGNKGRDQLDRATLSDLFGADKFKRKGGQAKGAR